MESKDFVLSLLHDIVIFFVIFERDKKIEENLTQKDHKRFRVLKMNSVLTGLKVCQNEDLFKEKSKTK